MLLRPLWRWVMSSFLSEERTKIALLMEKIGCAAPIRRASHPMYLLATPLLQRENEAKARLFMKAAEAEGWTCAQENGWILLYRAPEEPEIREIHPSGECACLCSLLRRHASRDKAPEIVNMILKAADENAAALERTCEQLHGRFAALLREGRPIPDVYCYLNDSIWRFEKC